jgi:uncharacterized protein (TIGR02594 family)
MLVSLAARYAGLRELPGSAHAHFIQAWLEAAGMPHGSADEVPWCAAFMYHVAWLLDLDTPELPARARSWLTVGAPVKLDDAEYGDVVVLSRGASSPGPDVLDAPGHVGILLVCEGSGDGLYLIGGNQSDAVTVQRFPASRVLGVRRLA